MKIILSNMAVQSRRHIQLTLTGLLSFDPIRNPYNMLSKSTAIIIFTILHITILLLQFFDFTLN